MVKKISESVAKNAAQEITRASTGYMNEHADPISEIISKVGEIITNFDDRNKEVIESKMDAYCDYMMDPTRRLSLMTKDKRKNVMMGKASNGISSITYIHTEARCQSLYGLSFDVNIKDKTRENEMGDALVAMHKLRYQTSNYSEKIKQWGRGIIKHGDRFIRGSMHIESEEDSEGRHKITKMAANVQDLPFGSIIYDEEEDFDQQELVIYRNYESIKKALRRWKGLGSKVVDAMVDDGKQIMELSRKENYFTSDSQMIYGYENIMNKYKNVYDVSMLTNGKEMECQVSDRFNRLHARKNTHGEVVELWEEKIVILIINKQVIHVFDNPLYNKRGGVGHRFPFAKGSHGEHHNKALTRSLPELLKEPQRTSTMLINVYKDQILASMKRVLFVSGNGGINQGYSNPNKKDNKDDFFKIVNLAPNAKIDEYYVKPNNEIFSFYDYQYQEASRISQQDRYDGLSGQGGIERSATGVIELTKNNEFANGIMKDTIDNANNVIMRTWIAILTEYAKNVDKEVYWENQEQNQRVIVHKGRPTDLDFYIEFSSETINNFNREKVLLQMKYLVDQIEQLSRIDPRFTQLQLTPINFDQIYDKLANATELTDLVLGADAAKENYMKMAEDVESIMKERQAKQGQGQQGQQGQQPPQQATQQQSLDDELAQYTQATEEDDEVITQFV